MIFEGGSRSSTVMFINKVYNFLIAIHYYYYCVCVCVCVCVYDPCVLVQYPWWRAVWRHSPSRLLQWSWCQVSQLITNSLVHTRTCNRLRADKPSRCRTSHPGLLSLAIPPWVVAVSSSVSCGVRHTTWSAYPWSCSVSWCLAED